MSKPKDYIGKSPIFQKWDEKSFSFDTAHMPWLARLLYKALVNKAFHVSTRPDLPSDDTQLTNILGVPPEVWAEHRTAVLAMFTRDAETGLLWQKRLRNDWQDLYIYRLQQKKRVESRWAAAKALKTQQIDTVVLPAHYHGNTSRAEQSNNEVPKITHEDDAAPSATLRVVTPQVGTTANPAPQAAPADKKKLCDELAAYVFSMTEYQPPTPKSVRELIDRYPIGIIKSAFETVIEGKDKSKLCSTVKLFFQGGAAGIILAGEQTLWKNNLEWVSNQTKNWQNEEDEVETVDQYAAANPVPAGIDYSFSLIKKAREHQQKLLKSQAVKS
jgi:hypothetical protein